MSNIFNWGYDSWKSREPEAIGEPIREEMSEAGLDVWELGKVIRRVAALADGDLIDEARDLCAHADAMARLMERVVLLFRDAE